MKIRIKMFDNFPNKLIKSLSAKMLKTIVLIMLLTIIGSVAAAQDVVIAIRNNSTDQLARALQAGNNVNSVDSYGQTPLMHAASRGTIAVLDMLLSYGADVNAQTYEGWTPLMYAARDNSDPEVAKRLLQVGADPNVTNKEGFQAAYYAASNAAMRGVPMSKPLEMPMPDPASFADPSLYASSNIKQDAGNYSSAYVSPAMSQVRANYQKPTAQPTVQSYQTQPYSYQQHQPQMYQNQLHGNTSIYTPDGISAEFIVPGEFGVEGFNVQALEKMLPFNSRYGTEETVQPNSYYNQNHNPSSNYGQNVYQGSYYNEGSYYNGSNGVSRGLAGDPAIYKGRTNYAIAVSTLPYAAPYYNSATGTNSYGASSYGGTNNPYRASDSVNINTPSVSSSYSNNYNGVVSPNLQPRNPASNYSSYTQTSTQAVQNVQPYNNSSYNNYVNSNNYSGFNNNGVPQYPFNTTNP